MISNDRTAAKPALFVAATMMMMPLMTAQGSDSSANNDPPRGAEFPTSLSEKNIWQGEVGDGFSAGAQSAGISLGAGYGATIFGSREHHDLALASLNYGYMVGPVQAEGHWYRGNWELRGELFTGAQFSPSTDWLVGIAPHLRYNFATSTRWVPFVDAGAGVSATSIGAPDLSHYFEFNIQLSAGVRYFIRNNVALTAEGRYLHLSCAGINTPNLGANDAMGFIGVSWFF